MFLGLVLNVQKREESNCNQLEAAQSNNIKRGVESVLMEPVAFPGIGIVRCSTEVIE